MLETIREYAGDRLREGPDHDETERRHAEFFAGLATEWGPWVRSSKGPEAIGRLILDHANMRAALSWAVRRDRADVGSRIAEAMWMFWIERGHLAEGRGTIESLLKVPSAQARDRSRAGSLRALGALTYWAADYQAATAAYREAADIMREMGNSEEMGPALTDLAYALLAEANPTAALPLIEETLRLAREVGDQMLAVVASGLLGLVHGQLGNYPEALEALEWSLAELEAIEAGGRSVRVWVGEWKGRVGSILRLMGRLEEAELALVGSLSAGRLIAGNVGAATVTWQLAAVASGRGNHERALRLAGFSESMSERIGGSPPRALMLLPELGSVKTAARQALDDDAIERLWAAGRAMSSDEAIAYAVGDAS
jgi:tetratricopeptide (TPR) repeat protein